MTRFDLLLKDALDRIEPGNNFLDEFFGEGKYDTVQYILVTKLVCAPSNKALRVLHMASAEVSDNE